MSVQLRGITEKFHTVVSLLLQSTSASNGALIDLNKGRKKCLNRKMLCLPVAGRIVLLNDEEQESTRDYLPFGMLLKLEMR